jgi:hypothetical protein
MLLLLACTGTPDPTDTDTPVDTGETVTFSDVTVTPQTIPTVFLVRFMATGTGTGFVDFAPTGEPGWRATATATEDGAWEALIVGLPASSTGDVTVGLGETLGPTTTVETGAAPSWLALESSEGEPTPGFLVVGVEKNPETGAAILDSRGRPVWWSQAPTGLYGHLHTRARISPDNRVEYIAFGFPAPGGSEDGTTEIVSVSMDGGDIQRYPLPTAHHDFLFLPDGGMAWIDVEDRDFSGTTIRAETIVERDADGIERVVWSAWDTIVYDGTDPGAPEGYWTLGNHLEYVVADDSYGISLRNVDTIVKVDRVTGTVDWTVGKDGTLVADDPFDGQHGFDILDDELLVFDNGNGTSSRALRFTLGEGTATKTWEYSHEGVGSFVMGDAQELDNGNIHVMFSTSGTADEVASDGTRLATFSYADGITLGFVEWHETLVD